MKNLFALILSLIALDAAAQKDNALVTGQKLSKRILENERNTYTLAMQKGGYFECDINQAGTDVAIDLISPSNNKLQTFDSPNGDDGREHISFVATDKGNYKLQVYMLEAAEEMGAKKEKPGNYTVTNVTLLTAAEYTQKLQLEKQQLNATKEWVSKNAHALKSLKPANNYDDLKWMSTILADVKYVGIGEATHGTKEYFQLKHRIFEFLVKEMGFYTFALEASYAGCKNINDYIQTGKGSARAALATRGFWTWNTDEMVDLIEWMRKYNLTTASSKKLSFIGIDIQNNVVGGGAKHITTYLNKVSPVLAQRSDSIFKLLAKAEKVQMRDKNAMGIRKAFTTLKRSMQLQRDTFVRKSSRKEYEDAMEYANNIDHYLGAYAYRGDYPTRQQIELRDKFMADNFKSYARQNPDEKILLWAHNNHISKNPNHEVNGGQRPMGSHLRTMFGNSYYAMGFLLGKGSFLAMDQSDSAKASLKEFEVNAPKENSLEWVMQQTGDKQFIVNFRDVKDLPADVKAVTDKEFMTRSFGSSASKGYTDDMYTTPVIISKDFDALIFIDNTSATKATIIK